MGEMMAVINSVHQLGSSLAIVQAATKVRLLLTVIRHHYRHFLEERLGNTIVLPPPLRMYRSHPISVPKRYAHFLHVAVADLAQNIDDLENVSVPETPKASGHNDGHFLLPGSG